jgi:hypothetical protein
MNTFIFVNNENEAELREGFVSTAITSKSRVTKDLVNPTHNHTSFYKEGSTIGKFLSVNYLNSQGAEIINRETNEHYVGMSIYIAPGRVAHNQNTTDQKILAKMERLQPGQVVRVSGPMQTSTSKAKTQYINIQSIEVLVLDMAGNRSWVEVNTTWPIHSISPTTSIQPQEITDYTNVVPVSEYQVA